MAFFEYTVIWCIFAVGVRMMLALIALFVRLYHLGTGTSIARPLGRLSRYLSQYEILATAGTLTVQIYNLLKANSRRLPVKFAYWMESKLYELRVWSKNLRKITVHDGPTINWAHSLACKNTEFMLWFSGELTSQLIALRENIAFLSWIVYALIAFQLIGYCFQCAEYMATRYLGSITTFMILVQARYLVLNLFFCDTAIALMTHPPVYVQRIFEKDAELLKKEERAQMYKHEKIEPVEAPKRATKKYKRAVKSYKLSRRIRKRRERY